MRALHNLWHSRKARWRAARILILLIAGLGACIVMFENKLIYFPSKYPEGDWNMLRIAGSLPPMDCDSTAGIRSR